MYISINTSVLQYQLTDETGIINQIFCSYNY